MITNQIAHWRSKMNNGKGISRAWLARKVGVGRSFVSKLEKGRAKPGLELVFRMARYFGQPVEAVFQQIDNVGGTKPAIFCARAIPYRQPNAAPSSSALTKPVCIAFPDAHPSAPMNQLTRRKTTKTER
jgi:putative transcriptional regulator